MLAGPWLVLVCRSSGVSVATGILKRTQPDLDSVSGCVQRPDDGRAKALVRSDDYSDEQVLASPYRMLHIRELVTASFGKLALEASEVREHLIGI